MNALSGSIYCIGERPGAAVKVGYAVDPQTRLVLLQCGNPAQLEILGVISGDRALEATLHSRFATLRIRGEWFMDCGQAITRFFDGKEVVTPTIGATDLLAEVRNFLAVSEMSAAKFGVNVANDFGFVQRLASGTEPRAATVAKVRNFIASHTQARGVAE